MENIRKLQILALLNNRPLVTPFITVEIIRDKIDLDDVNGKYNVIKSWKKVSESWNRNWYNYYMSALFAKNASDAGFGDGFLNIKDTSNTVRNGASWIATHPRDQYTSGSIGTALLAPAATLTYGIVYGTGVGAEAMDDYALGTLIAEGAGAGQMNYSAVALVVNWDGSLRIHRSAFSRIATNNSGGNIDVTESALYARLGALPPTLRNTMINRDVFTAQTIVHGDSIRVSYDIELTVPSVA